MSRNIKKTDKIKFFIFITIVVLSIIFIAINWKFFRGLNVERVVRFIKHKGPYAMAIFLAIYAVKPFLVVIPSNVVAIIGGILFGPIKGFLLSMTGFWISGTIAFYLSRFLGKDFVQSIVGDKFIKLDQNMKENGFKILLLLRLPPILPYDPLSYACGFTDVEYGAFITASVLGVVPETLCYSIMGRSFRNPFSAKFIIPLILIILATVFSKKIMDKSKAK